MNGDTILLECEEEKVKAIILNEGNSNIRIKVIKKDWTYLLSLKNKEYAERPTTKIVLTEKKILDGENEAIFYIQGRIKCKCDS